MKTFNSLCVILILMFSISTLAAALPDLPFAIDGAGATSYEGKFYIFGGHDGTKHLKTVFRFDPATNAWQQMASMPNVAATAPAVGVIDGKFYVIGGGEGEPEIQIYDPQNDTWTLGAAIPQNRNSLTGTVLDGKLHILCGDPWSGGAMTDHSVYDPAKNSWSSKAKTPVHLSQPISTTFNGKIYLFGGLMTPTPPQDKMYIYDPTSDSWTQGAAMLRAGQYTNCNLFAGKAYILGGNDNAGSFADVQCYNFSSQTWSSLTKINPARRNAAAAVIGNDIYFCGGIDENGTLLRNLQVYPLSKPPIIATAPSPQCPNSEFWMDIKVGNSTNPVSELKVVSFELAYTNTSIIDYVSSQNGTFLTNSSANVVVNDAAGKVSASVYKTSGGNTGDGTILRLKFKINSNAQDNQEITFSFNEILANNIKGETVELYPEPVTIKIEYLLVWPGDVNNDGKVEIFDVNPIVTSYWQKTGPGRPDATIFWNGQQCPAWLPREATFADGNGDGKVSITDINPVAVNFGKTHSLQKGISVYQNNLLAKEQKSSPTIKFIPREGYDTKAQEFWVDVLAGSEEAPLQDVKVISFESSFTNTELIDYSGYDTDSNELLKTSPQALVVADDDNGLLSASVFCTETGENGSGIILSLKFKGEYGTPFDLVFQNILANTSDGDVIPLEAYSDSVRIIASMDTAPAVSSPDQFELCANYPNPFNPSTTIEYKLPSMVCVKIKVFNAMGHKVKTLVSTEQHAGHYSVIWDAKNDDGIPVASGLYYYSIQAGDFQHTRKMLYLK